MKFVTKVGLIAFFAVIAFYGLYMHSVSMMGVSSTFAQEADHDADSDHDHISESSTMFKGSIFHITQPGLPTGSARLQETHTAPPGPWVLQGSWKLKVDQAAEALKSFEANLSMVRSSEPTAGLLGGGTLRNWHAMQISMESGEVINVDGETLHVLGDAIISSNGNEQFGLGAPESVEIILSGGGGLNPAHIAIWFDTNPEAITNTQFIQGTPTPKNARVHFGGVLFGTVDREK